MQNLNIVKMLTVSTNHVTEKTLQALKSEGICDKMQLSVYVKGTANNGPEYGLYIDIVPENLNWDSFPRDLSPLIKLAVDNDCSVLCLDCDGPELEGYEIY